MIDLDKAFQKKNASYYWGNLGKIYSPRKSQKKFLLFDFHKPGHVFIFVYPFLKKIDLKFFLQSKAKASLSQLSHCPMV